MQGCCIPLKPRRLGLRHAIVPQVRRFHPHNKHHHKHHANVDGNLHSDQLPHHPDDDNTVLVTNDDPQPAVVASTSSAL